ncbi:MAG: hypothetical protein H6741_20300 [Alphaproteobacteria bacterium]|nr:hypothetical protein [Alphaproteobacteria bacterium]
MRSILLLALLPLTAFAQERALLPDGPPPAIRVVGEQVDEGVVALWDDDRFSEQALSEMAEARAVIAHELQRAEERLLTSARYACTGPGQPISACEDAVGPEVRRLQCVDRADTQAGALLEASQRAAKTLEDARLNAEPGNNEVADIERRKLRVALDRMRQVEVEAAACQQAPETAEGALTWVEIGYAD